MCLEGIAASDSVGKVSNSSFPILLSVGVEQRLARNAHNVQVVGSNPTPATIEDDLGAVMGVESHASGEERARQDSPSGLAIAPVIASEDRYPLMRQAGIAETDMPHADYVISKESSWRPFIWNAQGSQAFGLPQRMLSHWPLEEGEEFMTDPVAQLKWADWYAKKSYGSWEKAVKFWKENNWW